MHYIGIDTSKDTFHAAFEDEKVLIFDNSREGIEEFIKTLIKKDCAKEDILIGTESTGVYHLLLAETLRSKSWKIMIINPLIAHKVITAGLRRLKTDKHDAIAIRKCLMMGAGHLYTDTPEVLALKAIVQEREALVKVRATIKQRIHAHKLKEQAADLKISDGFARTLKMLVYEIRQLEKEMSKYLPEVQTLLRSIPGIGITASGALVAYIGDINRFENAEKLTAYIGLDPRVHESGTSVKGRGYISKRGNRYLRHILYSSAFIAKYRNPEMKRYYAKKKSEGKHHFSILCAIERKLVHTIFAVWKRSTPFKAR